MYSGSIWLPSQHANVIRADFDWIQCRSKATGHLQSPAGHAQAPVADSCQSQLHAPRRGRSGSLCNLCDQAAAQSSGAPHTSRRPRHTLTASHRAARRQHDAPELSNHQDPGLWPGASVDLNIHGRLDASVPKSTWHFCSQP